MHKGRTKYGTILNTAVASMCLYVNDYLSCFEDIKYCLLVH